jgi:hypothetical protein
MGKISKNGLDGGADQRKGESRDDFSKRRHESYVDDWTQQKKDRGEWLPADEYERRTGKKGRK